MAADGNDEKVPEEGAAKGSARVTAAAAPEKPSHEPPTEGEERRGRIFYVPGADESEQERRRARLRALWSVHHALHFKLRPADVRGSSPVHTVWKAVQVLMATTEWEDPTDQSENLVALRWLGELRELADHGEIALRERDATAIEELSGEAKHQLVEVMRSEYPAWDEVLGDVPHSSPRWFIPQGGARCSVTYSGQPLVSTATSTIAVRMHPSHPKYGNEAFTVAYPCLTKMLDPRAWRTLSHVFQRTYEARLDSFGDALLDSEGYPLRAQGGTPGGTGWSGVLYECVGLDWVATGDTLVRFENLLDVAFAEDRPALADIEVTYDLRESLRYSAGLFGDEPGGLEVDDGWLRATRLDTDTFQLECVKHVRFSDTTPFSSRPPGPWDYGLTFNYLAPALLCMWLDLTVHGASWLTMLEEECGT